MEKLSRGVWYKWSLQWAGLDRIDVCHCWTFSEISWSALSYSRNLLPPFHTCSNHRDLHRSKCTKCVHQRTAMQHGDPECKPKRSSHTWSSCWDHLQQQSAHQHHCTPYHQDWQDNLPTAKPSFTTSIASSLATIPPFSPTPLSAASKPLPTQSPPTQPKVRSWHSMSDCRFDSLIQRHSFFQPEKGSSETCLPLLDSSLNTINIFNSFVNKPGPLDLDLNQHPSLVSIRLWLSVVNICIIPQPGDASQLSCGGGVLATATI